MFELTNVSKEYPHRQGKVTALRALGFEVAAVERLHIAPTPSNREYLRTKRDRMGHDLVLDATDAGETA